MKIKLHIQFHLILSFPTSLLAFPLADFIDFAAVPLHHSVLHHHLLHPLSLFCVSSILWCIDCYVVWPSGVFKLCCWFCLRATHGAPSMTLAPSPNLIHHFFETVFLLY